MTGSMRPRAAKGSLRGGTALTLALMALCGGAARAQEATTPEAATEQAQTQSAELPPAQAAAPPQEAQGGDIVVTGSRIRGVGPVGSTLIGISTQDIAKTGLQTTTDVLRTLPQVTSFGADENTSGGNQVQNSSINNTYARSINLRGLGTTATLNLVDGYRVAPGGQSAQLFDVDSIPTIAISRVDVVPDGGSAIYGSDAIAGTVNFILRKPFDGLEVRGRYGSASDLHQISGSAIAGKTWSGGGFTIAYEYLSRNALQASDRARLYSGDLSAYGGPRTTLSSNPGNVTINGKTYAIPPGQNGVGLTLSDLNPTAPLNYQSPFLGADVLPRQRRNSVVANFTQELNDAVKFHVEGFFTKRDYQLHQTATANTAISVPSSNPYSPCNPAADKTNTTITCPPNGAVTVNYSFINDVGVLVRNGGEQVWMLNTGFDVKLPHDFHFALSGTYSENKERQETTNGVNSNLLSLAVGNVVAGQTKPASIPYFNPFCDGTSFACNDPATLDYIRGVGNTPYLMSTPAKFDRGTASATLDGPLFTLPGGAARIALGGEYIGDRLDSQTILATNTLPGRPASFTQTVITRNIKAAYGELYIPLFGPDNATGGFYRLDISVAGRIEKYSDFGSTKNPKIGVNWEPFQGLKFRGSYGKSFRAPTLADVNPLATGRVFSQAVQGVTQVTSLPAGAYNVIITNGGNASLKPEKATTYSFGVDVIPPQLRALHLYGTYYHIDFRNRIDTPAFNVGAVAALNSTLYDSFLLLNPALFGSRATLSQADFNAAVLAKETGTPPFTGAPPPVATVAALLDGTRANTGTLKTDGFDFGFDYRIPASFGTIRLGGNGTYVLHFRTSPIAGVPLTENRNRFGYPLRFAGRAEVGVDVGGISATAFVNYQNAYRIDRAFIPVGAPDKYLRVNSYTTVDLSLAYNFTEKSGALDGLTLSVTATNLFDRNPPLVLNNGASPVLFDPQNASVVGRLVAVQVAKKF